MTVDKRQGQGPSQGPSQIQGYEPGHGPRYVCIHGHFYQPPRENPWLDTVEVQDSAHPYHDWNERITAECYEPNASARILDDHGRIARIVSNYARTSFNFGPTLLSWLQQQAPRVYEAIVRADAESQRRFSGHGSAMAQAYNHMILPLANRRDQRTQVLWGLRDFALRFGRLPEGMWLPETAVDTATLEALAEQGIRFTVLAPHQARAVRPRSRGDGRWLDVSGGRIDPRMPYETVLPSGRRIALFFYDGPISRAVAFERLLHRGEALADRLLGAFQSSTDGIPPGVPQLVHIATDGETYGHHHPFGEMALAYALTYLEQRGDVRLTNYGEILARHPPEYEVQIAEQTAWSCAHGVERWRSDCGCNSGGKPGWHQRWRGPLREALDHLRDQLAPLYEQRAAALLRDPWSARDAYIDVILDRSDESRARYLADHARRPLGRDDQVTVWQLLELQRHTQLMYTSCAWFFDDIGGPEATQNLQYAARVLQLGRKALGVDLTPRFLAMLQQAPSNQPEIGDGERLFERTVQPSLVNLETVAAHYALTSLFRRYEPDETLHCYAIQRRDYTARQAGRVKLCVGRATVTCGITQEAAEVSFAALHLGDHNLTGGVRSSPSDGVSAVAQDSAFGALQQELLPPFSRADLPEVLRALDRNLGPGLYSLRSLFRDEQRRVLDQVLATTLAEVEADYRQIYERHAPLMRFLMDLDAPQPMALRAAAEQAVNTRLRAALSQPLPELAEVVEALDEAQRTGVRLDEQALSFVMTAALARLGAALLVRPYDLALLGRLDAAVRLSALPPFHVNLWRTQNTFYELLQTVHPEAQALAAERPSAASAVAQDARALPTAAQARLWLVRFQQLGERLKVRVG